MTEKKDKPFMLELIIRKRYQPEDKLDVKNIERMLEKRGWFVIAEKVEV